MKQNVIKKNNSNNQKTKTTIVRRLPLMIVRNTNKNETLFTLSMCVEDARHFVMCIVAVSKLTKYIS